MSTRAIIAVPTAKGYKTAWCWNDAFPNDLGKKLRSKFTTKELADELVSHHSFSSLFSKKEKEDVEKEWPIHFGEFVELSNGSFILMHEHMGKTVAGSGKYGFFRTIQEMLGQDLNYVYVFNNGKWDLHK